MEESAMVSLCRHLISSRNCPHYLSDRELGGKAWNLFRLLDFGFPIPRWCVLTTGAFKEAVHAHRGNIEKILTNIDFTDQASVDSASSQISEIILNLELEDPQGFFAALERWAGKESLFSVRSSVLGEDSENNSFAGQMDSFLNVPLHHITNAIKKVWASAFSSRAMIYRKRKDISLTEVSIAVIIQKMVQSAVSGVLFTRDPENRAKQCVISAGFGLGEGVVADIVETDTYRIDRDSGEIFKEVSVKDCRLVLNATPEGGNRKEPVPAQMKSRPVLTDAQIKELRGAAIKAEKCFGAPQDIEWAFDRDGRLFILQTRPIVSAKHPIIAPLAARLWDNSNIVESYPGLALPLTFSFVRAGYENTFRNAALSFLLFKNGVKEKLHIFKNMIGLLDGRIYYNLLNWYEMLSYLPGFKKHKDSWDRMIGISHRIEFPQSKLSPFNRLYSLLIAIWKLLTVGRTAKRFFAHFNPVYSRFKDTNLSTSTEHELVAIYELLTHGLADQWHLTLDNDFSAMTYYDWLKKLSNLWGLSGHPNLNNDLLCGETGVESVAPLRSLAHLAGILRGEPLYQSLISEENDCAAWEKIQREPAYAPLKKALELHLNAFGDRGLEELKLEIPGLREDPQLLMRLIKSHFQLGLSVETMEKKEQGIRRDAEKFVRHHLKNPLKRLVFWLVLRNARRAIANRENMRFARSRLFGVVRRLFQRMGELFAEKGLLESGSDIHYLTVDEVLGFVEGTAVTQNLKALVEIRKEEYAAFAKRTPKERIQTTGIPYLSSFHGAETITGAGSALSGIACSSGTAEGTAKVIFEPRSTIGAGNCILIARSTDPGWVFLMIESKGIVVEKGSVLSHTAIIGRELGIPTIVGVKDATKRIPDGARMAINGSTGEIRWE